MALLLLDQILSANDLKAETVSVPEWGGEARVRRLTAAEVLDMDEAAKALDGADVAYAALVVAYTLCDESGQRLAATRQAAVDLAKAINAKGYGPVKALFAAARRLSRLGDDQAEEVRKN